MPRIRDDLLDTSDRDARVSSEESKRKRTSYNAFIDQERYHLLNQPLFGQRMVMHMSTTLGERWRCMSAEEKLLYINQEEGMNSEKAQLSVINTQENSNSRAINVASTSDPDFSQPSPVMGDLEDGINNDPAVMDLTPVAPAAYYNTDSEWSTSASSTSSASSTFSSFDWSLWIQKRSFFIQNLEANFLSNKL